MSQEGRRKFSAATGNSHLRYTPHEDLCEDEAMGTAVGDESRASGSRPTIRDVAAAAGVSKSLVSLAFKDPQRVSDKRRQLILRTARKLGYQPNFLARSLATDGSPFVGILVVNLHNPIFAEIADAVRVELDARGEYGLITSATVADDEDPEQPYGRIDSRVIAMLQDLRPKALIVVGTVLEHEGLFDGIPTVYASSEPSRDSECTSVRMDDTQGAELVIDHLRGLGHERIAFVGGQGGAVARTREKAYRRAMESRGLRPIVRPAGYFESDGYAAAEELLALPSPPTAIVSINDISAIGVLAAADDAGVAVPDELAVVGVDNISLSALKRISLTSVDPQNQTIGRLSARAVFDMLADPEEPVKQHLITPELVVRHSTVRENATGDARP